MSVFLKGIIFAIFLVKASWSIPLPPPSPSHPGHIARGGQVTEIDIHFKRKGSLLFLPEKNSSVPLFVFGHGQALKIKNYKLLLEKLTGLGFAVLFPQYDKGFFDTDWERMGKDFDEIVTQVIHHYPFLSKDHVVYGGHSKGAYIALMALGHHAQFSKEDWSPKASVLISPAGFDKNYLKSIPPSHNMSLIWPIDDTVIKKELLEEIFEISPSRKKQLITVEGYPELSPDHFFVLTKKAWFGGSDGISPFHYYGLLPWIHGAIYDNSFLYGERAFESGDPNNPHMIQRSW